MSTLASNPQIKKMIHSISEIWFIIILSIPAWSMTSYLIVKEFDNFTFVLTLFFTIAIGLLIKQLFQKTGWISSLLGFLLSLASLYMIGAFRIWRISYRGRAKCHKNDYHRRNSCGNIPNSGIKNVVPRCT